MTERVYLDYNATTPLAPEVVAAMLPYLDEAYGNPSSLHWAGLPARDAVEIARSQVAALLCCDATEVVFTSGGTEANNQVIKGLFFSRRAAGERFHVITSQIEHPAILEPCRFIERLGAEVTRLPVDGKGQLDPADVAEVLRPHTALISIMHANNEVGTIQPITEIAQIAREHGILCHTDAAQTVGKIATDVDLLGVDLLSVAGHKLYGPKGVGALFIRKGVALEPLLHGAGHEAGRRAGTENIVGLGAACQLAQEWTDDQSVRALRDELWRRLREKFGDGVVLNGHPTERLPNTLNVSFLGHHGHEILSRLPNLAASTGSACHAGSLHISPVLAAPFVVSGLGIAAFHVYLVQTGKLECPPALFGWGDGPLQSLLMFASLTLVCLAGAWSARRAERAGGMATVVAVAVLGCIAAWACIASAPPLPPVPKQPYDDVKQPFDMCRPPFPGA